MGWSFLSSNRIGLLGFCLGREFVSMEVILNGGGCSSSGLYVGHGGFVKAAS